MSVLQPTPAASAAARRPPAQAGGAAAPARRESLQALLLAILAALLGRLNPLALVPAHHPLAHQLPHSPYAVPCGTKGPTTARHRGPVPARALRLGRFPLWWARNRGPRAIPSQALPPRRTQPARAPPCPIPIPSVTKQRPHRGAPTHAH